MIAKYKARIERLEKEIAGMRQGIEQVRAAGGEQFDAHMADAEQQQQQQQPGTGMWM